MRKYIRTFRIKESFPIERGERWNVREGNKIVEYWHVDWVNDKNTLAEIHVTEYKDDENEAYF